MRASLRRSASLRISTANVPHFKPVVNSPSTTFAIQGECPSPPLIKATTSLSNYLSRSVLQSVSRFRVVWCGQSGQCHLQPQVRWFPRKSVKRRTAKSTLKTRRCHHQKLLTAPRQSEHSELVTMRENGTVKIVCMCTLHCTSVRARSVLYQCHRKNCLTSGTSGRATCRGFEIHTTIVLFLLRKNVPATCQQSDLP